jgi:DNA-binding PadR family transcriptional regulator
MRRFISEELHEQFHQHHNHRGPHGHGRHRARRGALGGAILALLAERPMHGYELITLLEERSGGRWKPSPGAIYPALGKLEHRGLVTSTKDDDKRRYELTEEGRTVAEQITSQGAMPWERDDELGDQADLRRAMAELVGPARQIGRFGTPEQSAAAVATVKQATAALYKILADGTDGTDGTA